MACTALYGGKPHEIGLRSAIAVRNEEFELASVPGNPADLTNVSLAIARSFVSAIKGRTRIVDGAAAAGGTAECQPAPGSKIGFCRSRRRGSCDRFPKAKIELAIKPRAS
jgi:hypothetical protein